MTQNLPPGSQQNASNHLTADSGIVLGTALVFTIQDMLLLLWAPGFYFDMFVGVLIVVAVIMNTAVRRTKS
jgi:simple sugar transport system permease protein